MTKTRVDDIVDLMQVTLNKEQRIQARDYVFLQLENAERVLHDHFGSVGVQSLDDCRKDLIDEEFPMEEEEEEEENGFD